MKSLLVPVLVVFALINFGSSNEVALVNADRVDVCHKLGNGTSQIITISINALPAHLAHGDALIEDLDGDGYVTTENDCVPGGDCDDQNAAVYPGAVENCADGFDNDCNGETDCQDLACAIEPICAPCCFDDVIDQFIGDFEFVTYTPNILFPSDQFYGIGVIDFGTQKFCGFQAPDGSMQFVEISEEEYAACANRLDLIAASLNLGRRYQPVNIHQSKDQKIFGFEKLQQR